jgi:hypothetical protein
MVDDEGTQLKKGQFNCAPGKTKREHSSSWEKCVSLGQYRSDINLRAKGQPDMKEILVSCCVPKRKAEI